jgi:O-antigen/teichoic acid export membrane protein
LIPGSFAKNVALLAGGTALGQAVLIAVTPLLTRLYSPADMGHFGVFSAAVGLCSVFVCLRYEAAIVSAEPQDLAPVTALALTLIVPASILAALGVHVGGRASVLGLDQLGAVGSALVGPTLALAGMANILRYWFIRQQEMRPISALVFVQNAVRAVAQLAFGLSTATSLGLMLGETLGRAAGVGGLARRVVLAVRKDARAFTGLRMRAVAAKYKSFSTYFLVSSFIDVLAISLPIPLMAQGFGADAAGQFALVQRVIAAPLALVAGTFADAFHGRLAALAREQPEAAMPFFWKSFRTLALLAVVPTALFTALSPRLFPLVFGESWRLAGSMAALMGSWTLSAFVVSPLSRVVIVYDGQRMKFIYDVTALALVIGAFKLCVRLHASVLETVGALAVIQTFAFVVYFAILVALLRRRTRPAPAHRRSIPDA